MGAAYYVTPSACHDIPSSIDDSKKSDLNSQVFHGLRSKLKSLDQGLICSSVYNVEKLKEAAFDCYYLLLPSENGAMLLRRIAGSEEILPINESIDQTTAKDIEDSIEVCLEKMQLNDYNHVLLEDIFHQNLNSLVKKSLDIGEVRNELFDFIGRVTKHVSSQKDIRCMQLAVDGYQGGSLRFLEMERIVLSLINTDYNTTALTEYCKSLQTIKGRESNFIHQIRVFLIDNECATNYIQWLQLLKSYRRNYITFDDLSKQVAQKQLIPSELWADFNRNIKGINMYSEEEIEIEDKYMNDETEDDEDEDMYGEE